MEEAKKILADVISKLAQNAALSIYNMAKDYIVDRENKEKVDTKWAYEDYLTRVYDTYSKSKSMLYTNAARELSKFFVPSFLKFEDEIYAGKISTLKEKNKVSTKDINSLLIDSTKLVITGVGGLGKTMHMKHFCIKAIEDTNKIPVFIFLRSFNDYEIGEKTFEEMIYDKLRDFGFELDYEYFEYSLKSNMYLFLFDGYDEISSSKRMQISSKIQKFTQRYSENCFIISTRELEDVYSWNNFKIYSLCPLNHKQSVQLIWKLDFRDELKKNFIDELNSKMFEKYKSFISVPLLLSILFLTYADNMVLPETLMEFYERAFDTMLYRHDRLEKSGFVRELESGISYENYRKIFVTFCFISYFKDQYSFSESGLIDCVKLAAEKNKIKIDSYKYKNDLVEATCMLYKDGLEYSFIHRSFQEYFAALYVSQRADDQQNIFCSRYLSKIDKTDVLNQSYDFFKMLSSIEPERFEYIVLKPILSKINKAFVNNGENYVDTIRLFFRIQAYEGDINDNEVSISDVFVRLDTLQSYDISMNMMKLLFVFEDVLEKHLECEDIVIKQIFENCKNHAYQAFEKEDYIIDDNLFSMNQSYNLDELFTSTVDEMLTVFIVGLKRYEELNSQEMNNCVEFDNMLLSF